ncbi:copper chaperone PCu(A)C [Roseospirillum parvum]|uniref:Copper(I)-binding protein n=1 Tax=Roseospirillum parvum TaxID=83401 RepID=A0A1G8FPE5_9PROT|nr:copper chaperone PCu(A)C [Roseospirillum parvum]SDH84028.1 hypothetical protein SAMN05421742_11528 [Roseospirillum parvum]
MPPRSLLVACLLLVGLAAPVGLATPAAAEPPPRVEQPWARASAGMARAGGVFMQLISSGDADRLIAAASPVAEVVELHTHIHDNGVMRMRAVPFMEIPAGSTTALKPGGLHVMLIDLKAPLKEGSLIPLSLTFEHGGTVDIEVPVAGPGAMAAPSTQSPAPKPATE